MLKMRSVAATICLSAGLTTPLLRAQTYSVVYSFQGGAKDGFNPAAGVILNDAGFLYGTTTGGPSCTPAPCTEGGIAFKLTTTGTETVIHRFTGEPDGAHPYGALTANPFGTSTDGGASNMGTIFELTSTGATIIHNFAGAPSDGAYPYGGLVRDTQGNLYGTTSAGGASNAGTVFMVDKAGVETVLYSFTGGADGGTPYGGLLRTSTGLLVGTTSVGGVTSGPCFPAGCGVVFEVSAAGHETIFYSFTGTPDGANPYDTLVADSSGTLYGTTYNGGTGSCTNACGTIFELDPITKAETVLYSFRGYPVDGAYPYGGVVRDSSGNLYGATSFGGPSDNGTVFEFSSAGKESLLHKFTGGTDGGTPEGTLIMDSQGNLYGTTYFGGVKGTACGGGPGDSCGVVFKVLP